MTEGEGNHRNLKERQAGMKIADMCRKHGSEMSSQTKAGHLDFLPPGN
jgi:hypothetical protein